MDGHDGLCAGLPSRSLLLSSLSAPEESPEIEPVSMSVLPPSVSSLPPASRTMGDGVGCDGIVVLSAAKQMAW